MNTLMKGNSPLGMIYNQSAENIAYDSNNSVKNKIDSLITTSTSISNLSSYTAKTLIDSVVASGAKIRYISATGGQRVSDLPAVQAGLYIIYAETYYKQIHFFGSNGSTRYIYNYDSNTWVAF